MFCFLIVLYGLSLSEAYNIKVSGQVELGRQLSRLFRDAYYKLGKAPSHAEEKKIALEFGIPDSDETREPTGYKQINPQSQEYPSRLSVLDEMMQSEQHNLHLYGNHKLNKDKGPLNNVNL